jgi:hypothetical protein
VSAPTSRRRPSPVLLVILLAALATGAAASLLIGAATSPGAPPAPASELVIPAAAIADGVAAFVLALIALLVYVRVTGGRVALPGRFVVTFLVAVLVAILLIAAFRALGGGGPTPTGEVSNGQNTTGAPPNSTATNVTSHGTGPFQFLPSLPGWVPFVLIAAVLVVAVVVALPYATAYAGGRRGRSVRPAGPPSTAEVRVALDRAAHALDQGGDARTVIVRLYGDLLERVGPIVPSIEPATPEEIRQHLVALGIQPEAATVLTRLFEEARYSTHPLGADAAERVRRSVGIALADLSRASGAA